jgi:hypothetical protein
MSYKTKKANVGDVIKAAEFAYCVCAHDIKWNEQQQRNVAVLHRKNLTVDGYKQQDHVVGFTAYYDRKGRGIEDTVNVGCYDITRAEARFVVERTAMDGGGTGHGPNDVFPDGWHVEARRLNPDGRYNPRAEKIEFYQSGCFNCMVPQVEVLGKMRQNFETPIDDIFEFGRR